MSKRKDWIDGLRGLAMLFVIYGHILMAVRPYSLFTSPIKLPLFFAVSGYVFSFKNGDVRAFFKGLWRGLLLPWLAFSALYTAVKIAGGTPVSEAAWAFFSGNVAWYLPCLMAAEILMFAVCKLFRQRALQYGAMLALSAAGYFLSRTGGELRLFLGRSMIVQFYLLIGYVFRQNEEKIAAPKLWPAIFGAMYIGVGVYVLTCYESSIMDVQSNSYYNPLLCASMAVGGCCFLLYYGRYVKMPACLCFVGRNTLIFYLFHGRILDMLSPLIQRIPHALRSSTLTGLPISLGICTLLCGVCALCSLLVNRYLPFLAGKRRMKA